MVTNEKEMDHNNETVMENVSFRCGNDVVPGEEDASLELRLSDICAEDDQFSVGCVDDKAIRISHSTLELFLREAEAEQHQYDQSQPSFASDEEWESPKRSLAVTDEKWETRSPDAAPKRLKPYD